MWLDAFTTDFKWYYIRTYRKGYCDCHIPAFGELTRLFRLTFPETFVEQVR